MRKSKKNQVLPQLFETEVKKQFSAEKWISNPAVEENIQEFADYLAVLSENIITGKASPEDTRHFKAWCANLKAEEALLFRNVAADVVSQVLLQMSTQILAQIKRVF